MWDEKLLLSMKKMADVRVTVKLKFLQLDRLEPFYEACSKNTASYFVGP